MCLFVFIVSSKICSSAVYLGREVQWSLTVKTNCKDRQTLSPRWQDPNSECGETCNDEWRQPHVLLSMISLIWKQREKTHIDKSLRTLENLGVSPSILSTWDVFSWETLILLKEIKGLLFLAQSRKAVILGSRVLLQGQAHVALLLCCPSSRTAKHLKMRSTFQKDKEGRINGCIRTWDIPRNPGKHVSCCYEPCPTVTISCKGVQWL